MLIVSNAPQWSLFCILSLLTVWYTVSVSVLDNHVSVIQKMCIKRLKGWPYINYMCFEVHRVVYQGMCCIWSGEGVRERGRRNFPSSLMAFLTYVLETYSPHIDISNVGGQLACGFLFFLKHDTACIRMKGIIPRQTHLPSKKKK